MSAIAAQHAAAADVDEEEATVLRAAIEANHERHAKLQKQRQDMEVCIPLLLSTFPLCVRGFAVVVTESCWYGIPTTHHHPRFT